MNVFNIKNPRHKQILKEELLRVKHILSEGYQYSTDEIWDAMSDEDRDTALYSAKVTNPDELRGEAWDDIPEDVQDTLDLSTYELAKYDIGGRTNLRAIDRFMKTVPNLGQLTGKFLAKNGRSRVNDLTIKQSTDLLIAIHKFQAAMNPVQQKADTDDSASKAAWLNKQRQSGRSSGLD
jgi:hypothetical protein